MNHRVVQLEIKSLSAGEFEGYGAVFNNTDLGGDVILPGAFKSSLSQGKMPRMLYQHDYTKVAGVWTQMQEDSKGLYVRGRTIDTPVSRQAYVELKEGALDGLSIGYEIVDSEGRNPRKLKELNLWEVSLVTFAMNPLATVEAVKRNGDSDMTAILQSIAELHRQLIDEIVR